MKINARSNVLLLSLILGIFSPAWAGGDKPRIEALHTEEIISQCGCEFRMTGSTSNSANAVFLQWDTDGKGSMRLDGKLIQLQAGQTTSKIMTETPTMGRSYSYHLEGHGVRVIVKATVAGICPEEDDSCEVTTYKARVTVKSSGVANAINANGMCGC